MQLTVILLEPARPENVGAAARAMKTMGFNQLRIVGSHAHQQPAARWLAHGACDILTQCQHYHSLTQALSDVQLTIACTARRRGKFHYYQPVQTLLPQLEEKRQWTHQAALVFGREASGLTNDELACADIISYIPMSADYPSLNLAQAVMVYCYQLAALVQDAPLTTATLPATAPSPLHALRQRANRLLARLNISDDQKLADWLMQRLGILEQRDIAMLHRLLQDIEQRLSDNTPQPPALVDQDCTIAINPVYHKDI